MKYYSPHVLLLFVSLFSVLTTAQDEACTVPPDVGHCYMLFHVWHYDPVIKECQPFVYTGCGGNENRFRTEEDCYAKCGEKLVKLHPPADLTIGNVQMTSVFLFWHRPINYKLHDPDLTTVDPGNKVKTTPKPTTAAVNVSSASDAAAGQGTTQKSTNNTQAESGAETGQGSGNEVEVAGKNLSLSDYIGKNKVPFHFANLTEYVIHYKKVVDEKWQTMTLKGHLTEVSITQLSPSTAYQVYVSAEYYTNTSLSTVILKFTTSDDRTQALNCYCDKFGTIGGEVACNLSMYQKPHCPCKRGYAGLFCEICDSRHYRTAVSMPCHSCPCSNISSSGSCYFYEGYLHCSRCNEPYAGNLCHRCANGYYRDLSVSPSICKKCEGCSRLKPGLICNPHSGECLLCDEHVTGEQCDQCMPGYVGDPRYGKPCVRAEKIGKSQSSMLVSPWLISTVVIGIIIVAMLVLGVFLYRRRQVQRGARWPFWKIELQQDHDGVNFSAVPEDELERQHQDEEFYEKHQRGRSSKSAPYSQLQEDL